jgi:hypothetical protein
MLVTGGWLGAKLRPGSAGADTGTTTWWVLEQTVARIRPTRRRRLLVRADSVAATTLCRTRWPSRTGDAGAGLVPSLVFTPVVQPSVRFRK